MSKYDTLDARKELEQIISVDLKNALAKRGFEIVHNGSETSNAPGGVPDIEVFNDQYHINVEVTQRTKSSADNEYIASKGHLELTKKENTTKKCFVWYVSPETHRRMLDSIIEYNFLHKDETDLKILPICFETFELFITKLSESVIDLYTPNEIIRIFDKHTEFVDDQRIKKLFFKELFSSDIQLGEKIAKEEVERDQKMLESLIKDLDKLEDYLREQGIATGERAIDTLIYLVFIKLYEEKRVRDGIGKNRLIKENFLDFKSNLPLEIREGNRAIHELFKTIKSESEFNDSGMFGYNDNFTDDLNDDFVKNKLIPIFDNYAIIGTKIDALGAVYEVLALRANKDVKVGQFFTPENVVSFMVKLAEVDIHDIVLDPACGTGRFLIWSMENMIKKVNQSSERHKQDLIKNIQLNQLFGSDIDSRIAKIAKMNMWIHGDGKTNVIRHNGLLLGSSPFNGHDSYNNTIDIVLTNPPLGNLNYQEGYTDDFRKSMDVLPIKNKTQEKINQFKEKILSYRNQKSYLENEKETFEENDTIQEYLKLLETTQSQDVKQKIRQLKQDEIVKEYLKKVRSIKQKEITIQNNIEKQKQQDSLIRTDNCECEVTGNKMKGGALFINAIYHYLKSVREPEALPEWRGGKFITVIDEGVINTDDYSKTRDIIRKYFYIKALISLTRDTFVPVSNTSTKTSILYLIKKQDTSAVQKEPIFFAHAEKVGMNTKRKVCANHLFNDGNDVISLYMEFKKKVISSYDGKLFNRTRFLEHGFNRGEING